MADQATPLGLRDLTDAGKLADKRRELENMRNRDKIDWALNREFYNNNQWVFWNKSWPGGGRLEGEPTDAGDKPRYKVRLTNNLILPGVQHYVAQLTKNRPVIAGTPDSGSDRDLKAAQMGTALWEYWWTDFSLGRKLHTSLHDAAISQGYWHITWDPHAGKTLTFMVGPDGQPLIGPQWSDENLDIYREELESAGADPKQFERKVSVGDISVKPIPGENVLLDPASRTFEDAQYAFVITHMSADEFRARYPKDKFGNSTAEVQADAVPGEEITAPGGFSSMDERPKTVRRVYHGYFRKNPALPQGRYVCWIEGPDMILEDVPWYFPFDDLPLAKFPGLERPNSALDIPLVTPSRPIQKEINRTISQIMEHKNLTLKPQVMAPVGSLLSERLTTEPGRAILFNPINGAIPQWRDIPNLPSYVEQHLASMEARLDRLFNRMPSQRDQLPARIDSSGSIDLIQEAVADQISPVIQRMEGALVRAGMMMAKLAQKYYIEERFLKITGANGAVQVKKFRNADLEGGFSFHAEAGSGLPRTRAGKQARIEFMLSNQLIDQRTAMKYLDTADMTGLMGKLQSAEEQAYRTIEKLKKGQPLNPVAVQQAQQQVEQAMADPNADLDGDGQPDDPQAKMAAAQEMLQQAALSPMPHEDPQINLDVLSNYMNSVEFEALEPQMQNLFVMRFNLVMQQAASIAQAQSTMAAPVERPRVALQLKATTSAPVAGEILREAGIQVQDEEVAMPPLETWVTDSIDKPDADDAGNDPLTQAEQAQSMAQAQQTHALKMAKAAHEVALAGQQNGQAQQDANSKAQAGAHAEELHQMKMRHAEEMHQARVKQANRPPAKASPGGK